jgi:hypothetical protein
MLGSGLEAATREQGQMGFPTLWPASEIPSIGGQVSGVVERVPGRGLGFKVLGFWVFWFLGDGAMRKGSIIINYTFNKIKESTNITNYENRMSQKPPH